MRSSDFRWTHPSIVHLFGDEDPVPAIERLARQKVLEAFDKGWKGPPFNPLELADFMAVPTEASSDVPDARTVVHGDHVKIQFNPSRPRARIRFSIAHELAHILFPDVAEEERNRGGDGTRDDWQLEMLCNIAAAEMVMPIGCMPEDIERRSIQALMEERVRFDVSAEAFLIRVAKVASVPALLYCLSPSSTPPADWDIDYRIPSPTWTGQTWDGAVQDVAARCTAIGQTIREQGEWPGLGQVLIECVGMPGRKDARLPRVAVLIRPTNDVVASSVVETCHGDVLRPIARGEHIICQMVNDSAYRWGGGVAAQAARDYPAAQSAFEAWMKAVPRSERLGKTHFHEVQPGRTIASLVAQEGFGKSDAPRLRYAALSKALHAVAERAMQTGASVHMPKLGTGAAAGSWPLIEELVVEEFIRRDVPVLVYEPAPRSRRNSSQADLFL
jgi:Zn-dependent peptidase ImmA (M78 family)/O-acetyl-ADP-ribose deacetylase (regulator of RNase III)